MKIDLVYRQIDERTRDVGLELAIENLRPDKVHIINDVRPFTECVQQMLRISFIGAPETVKESLQELVQVTRADEIIFNSHIYDHAARLRSYELLAGMK